MKAKLLFAGLLIGTTSMASSIDTVRMVELQKVEIISTRATKKTPMAYTTVGKKEISKLNFGQDLPFLLMMSPSVVVTSDAGAGVGYTGIRVRGTDATRINITANGIPMNDAQSHSLYWVNMPDFASSIEDVQIQRGVGTSTNGAGAFGGSLNFKTQSFSTAPSGEISGSYGSYNTHKEMVKVSTGLIGGHWVIDARLSNIQSDGYIDRASSDLKSYFAQVGYYGKTNSFKFITFAGKQSTYHAWDGLTQEQIDEYGRRYNPCGVIMNGKDIVGYYDNQTDNYTQRNYQLLYSQILSQRWSMNVNLHYTDGEGYYEEYKNSRTLKEYGLEPFEYNGATIKKSNLVRRKNMDNGFGGGIFSFDYRDEKLELSFGGGANRYDGDHDGRVIWVQNYVNTVKPLAPDHKYYQNDARKYDGNLYVKANYEVARGLSLFADMQYRHIRYTINGENDNYDWNISKMQILSVNDRYNFFNPKAGLFYRINNNSNLYGSFAVAQKEPTRNNYTDAKFDEKPRSEKLYDYELGYNYSTPKFSAGVNLYYMNYKDQLVLTGEVNDIGEPLAANVDKSYRMGIELMAGVKIASWVRWDGNATFSRNKIKNYTEYLSKYDTEGEFIGQQADYLGTVDIAYSPGVIANSIFSFDYRNWEAAFQSSYVSKQYLTNSDQKDISLDAYFVSNLRLGYTFQLPSLRSLSVGISINNLFNAKYYNNGFGGSSLSVDDNGKSTRDNYIAYFPQATTNVLANITIRF